MSFYYFRVASDQMLMSDRVAAFGEATLGFEADSHS